MKVKIKSICGFIPAYETSGSAGMDIRARLDAPLTLQPAKRAVIPTGLFLELPSGYEAQIRARSGLAARAGIGMVNGIGTIDSDNRGEIKVTLINWGEKPVTICHGDRIAQMVVAKYENVTWEEVEEVVQTKRGEGGFGHTGKR
jgi:dUTP pyrophosphatase